MYRIRARALLAAIALLLWGLTAQAETLIDPANVTQEVANYKTTQVTVGTFIKEVSSSGSEYYPLTMTVRNETPNAYFAEYKVKRGQYVEAGDVLAVYDLRFSEVELATAQFNLKNAREALKEGEISRREEIEELRTRMYAETDMYEKQIKALELSRMELQLEKYIYEQERSIAQQEERIAEMEEERAANQLIAPMSGEVTEVAYKRVGDRVSVGETLIIISSHDVMLVRVDNTTGDYRYNMEVQVEVGKPKDRHTVAGRVVAADTLIPQADRTNHAFIALDPETDVTDFRNPKVRGDLVRVENAMLLPRKAVTLFAGKNYVTLLDGDMVKRRYVNYSLNNFEESWILQGIEEGDVIILN